MRSLYTSIIKKFFYTRLDHYKIYEYDKYNSKMKEMITKIGGLKIYIINIDMVGPSPLEIARNIREVDFINQIILVTGKDKRQVIDKLSNILFLDFISIDDNLIKSLYKSLRDAYRIATRYSAYTFCSFDEVYRILYKDIYYIEKNTNDDSVTIYTKDDSFINYVTIKSVKEALKEDIRFLKVHRSCIVNLYNISSYDKKNNTLVFNNGQSISLVSRNNKTLLIERLRDFNNEYI